MEFDFIEIMDGVKNLKKLDVINEEDGLVVAGIPVAMYSPIITVMYKDCEKTYIEFTKLKGWDKNDAEKCKRASLNILFYALFELQTIFLEELKLKNLSNNQLEQFIHFTIEDYFININSVMHMLNPDAIESQAKRARSEYVILCKNLSLAEIKLNPTPINLGKSAMAKIIDIIWGGIWKVTKVETFEKALFSIHYCFNTNEIKEQLIKLDNEIEEF